MEVGAVKQAFNNEVILLKKKLNQAKIHTIHKLTRKAKTLTGKKAPDHLKEKLKRKAESAVKEVLLIKKIKAKDIAKFIITHTGQVNDYLNKPQVDNDKACARLILHKSMQDKYTFFRNRFGNIPIKDLFMSRQERRKQKAEAKEQQKNKKKRKKDKITDSAGDWDVEDVDKDNEKHVSENDDGDDNDVSGDESSNTEGDESEKSEAMGDEKDSDTEENFVDKKDSTDDVVMENNDNEDDKGSDADENDSENDEEEEKEKEIGEILKLKPDKKIKATKISEPFISKSKSNIEILDIDKFITQIQQKAKGTKQADKKVKENKNKNLKDKMHNRKFKKDDEDSHVEGRKVVDPFFITASGENYLSLAEPRLPDEVKEVHKQGNRQERRAAMFGRKFKPRNDFAQNNFRSSKFENGNQDNRKLSDFGNKNDRFNKSSDFNDKFGKSNDRNEKFNERNSAFNNRNDRFSIKTDTEKKEEKLHPSWEAKRKLKSMSLLPSQGKKIVFDDN